MNYPAALRHALDLNERIDLLEEYERVIIAQRKRFRKQIDALGTLVRDVEEKYRREFRCGCDGLCGCGVTNVGTAEDRLFYEDLLYHLNRLTRASRPLDLKWRIVSRLLRMAWLAAEKPVTTAAPQRETEAA